MKQVPDTRVVTGSTILPDGTINRKALPTIINPNDMQALEMALCVKDTYPQSCVTVLSMGPDSAKSVIKEAMYRGADKGFLLSDAAFAGSDTLATSRILSVAIQQIGQVDVVFCGRQTIDGDTAHVGPQVAQWLGVNQVTAVTSMQLASDRRCCLNRLGDAIEETVEATLPLLVTVDESADACRFRQAKRVMAYKNEVVPVWTAAQLGIDATQCGLGGSATQVVTSQPVDLNVKESCVIENNTESIETWFSELLNTCIIA